MRTIIAGSRDLPAPLELVTKAVEVSGFTITQVVSGTARGIDQAGEVWATSRGIPVVRFPADWDLHGRAAGVMRNIQMAQNAEQLVAIWDGQSRGTRHMITEARRLHLEVYVHLTRLL